MTRRAPPCPANSKRLRDATFNFREATARLDASAWSAGRQHPGRPRPGAFLDPRRADHLDLLSAVSSA